MDETRLSMAQTRRRPNRPTAIPAVPQIIHDLQVGLWALGWAIGVLCIGILGWLEGPGEVFKIQTRPVMTQATVTRLYFSASRRSTAYYVEYRYTVSMPDGRLQTFETKVPVSRDFFYSLQIEQSIPIVYAAGDPAVSRLQAEYPPNWMANLGWFCPTSVGLPLLVAGVVLTVTVGGLWKSARELDESGLVTTGQVVERWKEQGSVRRPADYYVAYAFGSGQEAQQVVSASVYNALVEGTSVNVRYLPRDLKVSRLEFNGPAADQQDHGGRR